MKVILAAIMLISAQSLWLARVRAAEDTPMCNLLMSMAHNMDIEVEQLIWWPYKSARGAMALEMKMTRLNPQGVLRTRSGPNSSARPLVV